MKLKKEDILQMQLSNTRLYWQLVVLMGLLLFYLADQFIASTSAAVLVAGFILLLLFNPACKPAWILSSYQAKPIKPTDVPGLLELTADLSARAGLKHSVRLFYTPFHTPNAFVTGTPENGYIALSNGLLSQLSQRQLAGVIAHEIAHLCHGDVRVLAMADFILQICRKACFLTPLLLLLLCPFALFGLIDMNSKVVLLVVLSPLPATIMKAALSHPREEAADHSAAQLLGDPQPLIEAMNILEQQQRHWERFFAAEKKHSLYEIRPNLHHRLSKLADIELCGQTDKLNFSEDYSTWKQRPLARPKLFYR